MKKRMLILPACLAVILLHNAGPSLAQSPLHLVWTSAPGDARFGYEVPGQTYISHKLRLRGRFDFDGDGLGEFVRTLPSSDDPADRDNNVYLFEADSDNSYALRWSYQFTDLTGRGNGVAVGDLDNDGNPEIICLVQWVGDCVVDQCPGACPARLLLRHAGSRFRWQQLPRNLLRRHQWQFAFHCARR